VLDGLARAFEDASGRRYAVVFDSAKAMLARIKEGETGDVSSETAHLRRT